MSERTGCRVCDNLPPGDLIELDLLMGDASRWPATVWGIFDPPKGQMTAARQRFGAMEMGQAWLLEHGYTEVTKPQLRKHFRYDVIVVAKDPMELIARGVIAEGNLGVDRANPDDTIDPGRMIRFFDAGLKVGNRALAIMEERIERLAIAGKADEIPLSTLKIMLDLGAKLAVTQAALKARKGWEGPPTEEDEGFRAGSAPLPSDRMGHVRIRTVEGVQRPVYDEGPADREHYNERARQEGSPTI